MLGYWNDPDETAEAIDADGWMHTGDLATMDDDGYVQHRRADQGHDHPRRREHLSPRDRGVPLHAPRRSSTPRSSAFPTRSTARRSWPGSSSAAGTELTDDERSASSARARSPTSRSRATCRFVDEFPMTVTGKIRKFKMRDSLDRRARPPRRRRHRDRVAGRDGRLAHVDRFRRRSASVPARPTRPTMM